MPCTGECVANGTFRRIAAISAGKCRPGLPVFFRGSRSGFPGLWFRPEVPRAVAGVNDFMGIYAGARLIGTPEQFNSNAYIREPIRATGWSAPSVRYTRLPAFAALLRPIGRLDYRRAYLIWEVLSMAAFAAFLALWPTPHRWWLLIAACWSFPLFADLLGGQDVAFLLIF